MNKLTFEQLCPEWNQFIKDSGGFLHIPSQFCLLDDNNDGLAFYQDKLNLHLGHCCIVGEAWKFPNRKDELYDYCEDCKSYAAAFLLDYEYNNIKAFNQHKKEFVEHFNKKHLGIIQNGFS